ncbi:hypothetical protein [Lichenifustis flavocetrariae]|uniref:Uncharacterized protein n=1 Tax=Lichenifustis flavocetrariae TaxID=2949735 RepID=A0AA41YTR1_9HYPH|nr:hypothetical protein [Lichenifustis flavocetrariae]MCW6506673.1 hypothetical protein [Lichenifustis flavocetrariae]
MRMIYGLAALAGFMGLAVPAASLPLGASLQLVGRAQELSRAGASWGTPQFISDRHRIRRRRPVAATAPQTVEPSSGDMGGYVVNRYGYGNYVAGPAGYGGYPTGSAEAQIWKQRQEWKCQAVPERC